MALEILEITDSLIHILYNEEEKSINRTAFEKWVDGRDKRQWVYDYSEAGEHRQTTGQMNWDEYYHSIYVNSDIAEFLSARDGMTGKLKSMYDLGLGLKKLLKTV